MKSEGHQHLGNYLGVLKNLVDLQNTRKYECYFFLADLHSLTEEFDPKEKSNQIVELAAEYLAAGLDPSESTIFLQSIIPAHAELTWLLTTITPEGELRRMTQYKDKVMVKKLETNTGLLMYPILMAADILLYDPKFVPVGDDQLQHLELARTLARKFNSRFGKTFIEPQPIITKTPRVMSLDDPTKKMSKSYPQGCLFLDDSPKEVEAKIKRAVTDSGSEIKYDEEKKPAISNLLQIYSALSGEDIPILEKKFKNSSYADFKKDLTELIINHFKNFREKKFALMKKPEELKNILRAGSEKASWVADKKINEVKGKIGILL